MTHAAPVHTLPHCTSTHTRLPPTTHPTAAGRYFSEKTSLSSPKTSSPSSKRLASQPARRVSGTLTVWCSRRSERCVPRMHILLTRCRAYRLLPQTHIRVIVASKVMRVVAVCRMHCALAGITHTHITLAVCRTLERSQYTAHVRCA